MTSGKFERTEKLMRVKIEIDRKRCGKILSIENI